MKLPLSQLKPNSSNPRFIKDDKYKKLVQSLKDFPEMAEVREVVVNKDHVVLGGNMRLRAMKDAGWIDVPVKVVDWPKAKQKEFIIKDNASFGEWDWEVLANQWDAKQLDDWGIDLPVKFGDEEVVEDEAPPISAEPAVSVLGEIYQLGRHRVMCGDSTLKENVEQLMGGAKADVSFTSPPYNAKRRPMLSERKNGNKADVNKYETYDDDNEEYYELLEAFNGIALSVSKYSFVNLQLLAGNKKQVLTWLYSNVDRFVDVAFWKKNQVAPAMAENVMNSQVELVIVLGGNGSRAITTANFRGTVSNFVETDNASRENENSDKHNATFPVSFVGHFITNFTQKGGSVYDAFSGTGSTLIACEQTDRTCYGMELDPKYVDVIRKRYAKFIDPENWEAEWQNLTAKI